LGTRKKEFLILGTKAESLGNNRSFIKHKTGDFEWLVHWTLKNITAFLDAEGLFYAVLLRELLLT
jgi:hypothetical protein